MQSFVPVLWAFLILEAVKFGYTIGWDVYLNLGR
jgi:hypothetical protein